MTQTFHKDSAQVPEQEALARYNLLSLATREGIWDYDLESGQTWYNQGMMNLFGYTAAEMRDNVRWWEGNIHPNDRERVIKAVDDFLKGRANTWHGEYRFRCSNNEYKTVIEHLYVVRDEKGLAKRLMGTMQDLEPIKKMLNEVEKERLQHRNDLVKAITEAEEKERKIISDELHENINQVLAAISMHIEQAKEHVKDDGQAWLDPAQKLLLASMKGIKRLAQQLSPLEINHLGLKEALEKQLDTVTQNEEMEYVLYTDHDVEDGMSAEQKLFLYRIACLQIDNVIAHSGASILKVYITKSGDRIKLSVSDNGCGFDDSKVTFGVGLSKMQNRVPAYGGIFRLITEPGRGCMVEVIM
jgi:two-component system, NarL family, sensor histidine kinase UhpB